MSPDMKANQSVATNADSAIGVEAAEHERQFREICSFVRRVCVWSMKTGDYSSTIRACAN